MKKSNRTISIFLCIIMLLTSLPAISISAEESSVVAIATDLYYVYASGSKLDVSLESDDDGEYLRFSAAPGTYDNNGLVVNVSHHDVVALDYPYIKVG